MFKFLLVLSCVGFSQALVAFRCGDQTINQTAISLVHVPECKPITPNITTETVDVVISQRSIQDSIDYIRCSMTLKHHVFRCGKLVDTEQDGGYYSEVVPISKDTCKDLVERQIIILPGSNLMLNLKSNKESFSATTWGVIEEGSCTPGGTLHAKGHIWENAVRNTEIEVEYHRGSGIVNYENDEINFGQTKCKYSKGKCYNVDLGDIFWDNLTPACEDEICYYDHN
uniref:Uncharacterized protein n=1 Tax=Cacopsylla melanoneura TaxID=428564 RepID=A0A8D8X4D7_9HEMI